MKYVSVFKFEPIYKKRVWGGSHFKNLFDSSLRHDQKYGESWNIVDREEDQSFCKINSGTNISIRELLKEKGREIMGPSWINGNKFPILVKWLDCQERLSLQVHPPEELAEKLGGEPKTENWYVVDSSKNSGLFLGFNQQVTKSQFRSALQDNEAEKLCHRINSNSNDSVLVKSGSIHAIDAGNLILEIQQNSDTTYRVFDWGRVGLDGKPRDLHIQESLESINFSDSNQSCISTSDKPGIETIAECKYFRIRRLNLSENSTFKIKEDSSNCAILSPFKGQSICENQLLESGFSYISPFSSACEITSKGKTSLLITDSFLN